MKLLGSRNLGRAQRGLTLIELVLATALFSFMMVAVFQLVESSLSMWRRGDARRSVLEQTTTVAEILARDLRTLEGGQSGDLVIEWASFDSDKDGKVDSIHPRIRLVRQVTAAERALIYELTAVRRAEALAARGIVVSEQELAKPELSEGHALAEVVWVFAPVGSKEADESAEVVVYRGERLVEDNSTTSYFEPDFLSRSGHVPTHVLEEVSSGLLWIDVLSAAQTTVVKEGWTRGEQLSNASPSWDAWQRQRPDVELHDWNKEHPGLPLVDDTPAFPRRVRFEFEFERERDRRFRARTAEAFGPGDASFKVDMPERVPRGKDTWIMIGQEWMLVRSVHGDTVSVSRGERGSAVVAHEADELVHFGIRMIREVPIPVHRENWNLR